MNIWEQQVPRYLPCRVMKLKFESSSLTGASLMILSLQISLAPYCCLPSFKCVAALTVFPEIHTQLVLSFLKPVKQPFK